MDLQFSIGSEDPSGMEVVRRQLYKNFLIISFHGTLRSQNEPEIVEFPCLKMNCRTLEVESRFHQFIKPIKCSSMYSSEQTGINEEQLEAAYSFPQVLSLFHQWENEQKLWTEESAAFVTFGDYDFQYLLPLNCKIHSIQIPPHMKQWINIKKCSRFLPEKLTKEGLLPMLRNFGLIAEEGDTMGLQNCKNINVILCEFVKRNYVFVVNSTYKETETDESKKRTSVTKPISDVTFDRNISTPDRNDTATTNITPPNTPDRSSSPFSLKFPFPANKLMVHSSDRRPSPGVEWRSVVVKRAYAPKDRSGSESSSRASTAADMPDRRVSSLSDRILSSRRSSTPPDVQRDKSPPRRASAPADWIGNQEPGRRTSAPSDGVARRTSAPTELVRKKSPTRRSSAPVDGTVSSSTEKKLLPDRRSSAPIYRNISFDTERRVSQLDDRRRTNEATSRPSLSTERRFSRRSDSTASDSTPVVCIEDLEECQITNRRSFSYLAEETQSNIND